jgi:hypothetical protein
MPRRRGAQSRRRANGAGLGTLIVGLILASAGVYLFTNQVDVGAGPFGGVAWFGPNSFGLLLVPLLLGVGLLCVDFGSRMWVSGQNEHPFRSEPNGDFGRRRTLISDQTEHAFQLKPNTPGSTRAWGLPKRVGDVTS